MFKKQHLLLFFIFFLIEKPLKKNNFKGFTFFGFNYKLGKSPFPFVGKLVKPIK
jgi:hypothetical protein